jgi:beta-glucosidase
MVHVDFDNIYRTPKASYRWYRQLISAQPRDRKEGSACSG